MSGKNGGSFDLATIRTLALIETRTRLRRPATLVTLLAVAALAWLMVVDPSTGYTMISSGGARVRYTSATLAFGTASLATLLFAVAGFFLLRGRMAADLRSGIGGVIGASPAGGAPFLLARFCGGVLYLLLLIGAFMLTVLACHALHGEGPIEPFVYLQTYLLVLGPMVLFTAACATLLDSWAPLMGKAGDVLYFFVWFAQMGMLASASQGAPAAIPFDFMGMTALITALSAHLDVRHMGLGLSDFDRSLAPLLLPTWLWTAPLIASRCLTALLALLPLLPALCLFHRFSPDRVKAARGRARRSPLAVIDGWLRPLARLTRPLYTVAARLPGVAGQALGDVALTFTMAPSAIALLLAAQVLALVLPAQALGPLALACVACWGVLVSDVSTRDGDAACAGLASVVPGGAARRYWRQLAATCVLGLMFTGLAALRLAVADPVRGAALLAGVFALAALAGFLGRISGSARTFLALFLFGLYISVNTGKVALADVVAFHGAATLVSALTWAAVGLLAAWGGHLWNRRAQPV